MPWIELPDDTSEIRAPKEPPMTFTPEKSSIAAKELLDKESRAYARSRAIRNVRTHLARVKDRLDRIDAEEQQGYGANELERLVDNSIQLLAWLSLLEREGRAYFRDVYGYSSTSGEGQVDPFAGVDDRILATFDRGASILDDADSPGDLGFDGFKSARGVKFEADAVPDEPHSHDSSPSVGDVGGASNPTEGEARKGFDAGGGDSRG